MKKLFLYVMILSLLTVVCGCSHEIDANPQQETSVYSDNSIKGTEQVPIVPPEQEDKKEPPEVTPPIVEPPVVIPPEVIPPVQFEYIKKHVEFYNEEISRLNVLIKTIPKISENTTFQGKIFYSVP